MTEPGHREPSRPYRRKRKFQGATWTPTNSSADVQDGLWCKRHRQRHGYMSMGLDYEKRGEQWIMLWSCKETGDVLGETRLGEVSNDKGKDQVD